MSVADLAGSDPEFTGGTSPEEYVRQLRGDDRLEELGRRVVEGYEESLAAVTAERDHWKAVAKRLDALVHWVIYGDGHAER